MPRPLPLAVISLLLCAFQCEHQYQGPDIDFGPGGGITYRDVQSRLYRPEDPTDWTSDETWNQEELYNFPIATNGPQQLGVVSRSLAYPNPGKVSQVAWHFKLSPTAPCPCSVYAKLVNKRYDETDIYLADLAAGDSLQFMPKVYDPGQLYRLYYLVYNNNTGMLYKGHGDLRFRP
ncbi:MAG: hypothetical protein ACRYF0_14435 [Janthinobacterium lividum]